MGIPTSLLKGQVDTCARSPMIIPKKTGSSKLSAFFVFGRKNVLVLSRNRFARYIQVSTTWGRPLQKQVVDQIHDVSHVNRPVTIHVSILKGVRRRAAAEQVIDQIYHV